MRLSLRKENVCSQPSKAKKRQVHNTLYWEHMGNKAIRHGKWKLVSVREGKWKLYDMESDGTELNNIADKYPQKV